MNKMVAGISPESFRIIMKINQEGCHCNQLTLILIEYSLTTSEKLKKVANLFYVKYKSILTKIITDNVKNLYGQ